MDLPCLAPSPWLGPAELQAHLPQLCDPGSLVFLFLGAGHVPAPTTPSPHTSPGPWLGQADARFPLSPRIGLSQLEGFRRQLLDVLQRSTKPKVSPHPVLPGCPGSGHRVCLVPCLSPSPKHSGPGHVRPAWGVVGVLNLRPSVPQHL